MDFWKWYDRGMETCLYLSVHDTIRVEDVVMVNVFFHEIVHIASVWMFDFTHVDSVLTVSEMPRGPTYSYFVGTEKTIA